MESAYFWSGEDLNFRPLGPEPNALPPEPHPVLNRFIIMQNLQNSSRKSGSKNHYVSTQLLK